MPERLKANGDVFLENRYLSLCVTPLGAEMQYLRTSDGSDLLWHGDEVIWSGRAPVLFPIVGRAPDDTIANGTHTAKWPSTGLPDAAHYCAKKTADMCRHILRDTAQTRAVYPYAFSLTLIHRLQGQTLSVEAEINNLGPQAMPFDFGFHPAFCWPLPGINPSANSDVKHHISLQAGYNPDRVLLDQGLLRHGAVPGPFVGGDLELETSLFEEGALVFARKCACTALRCAQRTRAEIRFLTFA